MKKTLLLATIVLSAFMVKGQGMTQEERSAIVKQFEDTKATLLKEVNGLSDAQMKFKQAPDRWSVADCLEHITVSEKALFGMEQNAMAFYFYLSAFFFLAKLPSKKHLIPL